jgi:hypothetical protein
VLSAATLACVAMPSSSAQAAGMGLSGRLSVHTGGFNTTSLVKSFNLATGEAASSFSPVPQPANGRGLAFDADGNVLTTSLNPGFADFNGDGKIHKFPPGGGAEISSISVGLNLGAIDFDKDDNAIWGAVYQPDLGLSHLVKVDPSSGLVLTSCDVPFGPNNGAGNDTLAVAKIGGVKVLLTDVADGNLPTTTLYSITASACQVGALIDLNGPDVKPYQLKRGDGSDVARVTGVAVDPLTGDLLAASIAADEQSTDVINLGPAPSTGTLWQATVGTPLTIPGLVYDIGVDPTMLDDFNRADGGTFTSNLGPSWSGSTGGGFYRISSTQLKNQNSGYIFWNPTSFGANQETSVTFTQLSRTASEHDLILKVQGLATTGTTGGNNFSLIEVSYDGTQSPPKIMVNTAVPATKYNRPQWVTHLTFDQTLVNGDRLGAQALADGTVKVYRNRALIKQVNVADPTTNPYPFPATLAAGGGRVGLWLLNATGSNPALMDNFRGGTIAQ